MTNENIFTQIENDILTLWRTNKCFEKSNEISIGKKSFTFYDGPPFATGLPHYGHILSGTIKDVVTRYKYQQGFHVDRRFGWDCHGLPVEYEIDKMLKLTNRKQIEEMGIDVYNAHCRSIVMKYSNQWKQTVERMGRWVDFENGYKTMDLKFMSSVWFIFKMLFDSGLVYRGYKVMPFSTACMTPLSNHEVSQNYKTVNDPSIVIAFPLLNIFKNKKVNLLAWTTTPWTLPSNCGLVVNNDYEYVIFEMRGKNYIMLKSRIECFFKDKYKIIEKIKGNELVGLEYEQPFNYFEDMRKDGFFKVLGDTFVKDDSGTGIVHSAPGFGEEDYDCFVRNDLIKANDQVPCPIDENGKIILPVSDFLGMNFKESDKHIIKHLKDKILYVSQISHSYPFCWRSETPLIYKLVPTWFIKVTENIPNLLKNNNLINWIPEDVKFKRFHNWLANAKDWAISRNRFWGTPIPLLVSDDFSEILCIESAEELSKLSGKKVKDIHREFIDDIVIIHKGKTLRRIPEVFDCWFESGSMPYAQNNWPFCLKNNLNMNSLKEEMNNLLNQVENNNNKSTDKNIIMYKNYILKNFPADFIGEGIDQTRGWFYTLHVISTLLFNKPAFINVIVNGIVLAKDGKKMSKKEKNYPDPNLVFDKYGADSLRMYLISSPVVEAQDLKFKEEGVNEILKTVIIPWSNVLKFYHESIKKIISSKKIELDDWIMNKFNEFLTNVVITMDKYELCKVLGFALKFIDDISNWYVRIYRKEIREGHNSILKDLLLKFSIIMAPFMPFYSEYSFQTLISKNSIFKSVHYEKYPEKFKSKNDSFDSAKDVILAIRSLRELNNISLKTPLKEVTVITNKTEWEKIDKYKNIILRECNVLNFFLKNETEISNFEIKIKIKPYFENLKKDLKTINKKTKIINNLKKDQINKLTQSSIFVDDIEICQADVLIEKEANWSLGICKAFNNFILLIDNTMDENILRMKEAREFNSWLQKFRKEIKLKIEDSVFVEIDDDDLILACLESGFDMIFGTDGKFIAKGVYKNLDVILRKVN